MRTSRLGDHDYDFDLAVIGSGPAGQKAAIAAAKLDRRVCVVDRAQRQHRHHPVQDAA